MVCSKKCYVHDPKKINAMFWNFLIFMFNFMQIYMCLRIIWINGDEMNEIRIKSIKLIDIV